MGIVFAQFYISAYGILGAIAFFLGIYLGEWEKPYLNKNNIFLVVLGASISIILTLCSIYFLNKIENSNEWNKLIYNIAFSLIAPIIFGLITILIAKLIQLKKGKSSIYLFINKIGAGMFYGVCLLPAGVIFYMFGIDVIIAMFILLINLPMQLINSFFDLLV